MFPELTDCYYGRKGWTCSLKPFLSLRSIYLQTMHVGICLTVLGSAVRGPFCVGKLGDVQLLGLHVCLIQGERISKPMCLYLIAIVSSQPIIYKVSTLIFISLLHCVIFHLVPNSQNKEEGSYIHGFLKTPVAPTYLFVNTTVLSSQLQRTSSLFPLWG